MRRQFLTLSYSLSSYSLSSSSLSPSLTYSRCQEALDLNKHLITEEQQEYQHELVKNFRDFQNKLEPMVPTKRKHKRGRSAMDINYN